MISGALLKKAIISGSNHIAKQKKSINDMNIFPVPDGDTGTNMSMTIAAAAAALETLDEDAGADLVAKTAASAMLRGARGNSGVILSLLFRGLSKGLSGHEAVDAQTLLDALDIGVTEAYQAVMNPTEGTMLTVARVSAEAGRAALTPELSPASFWAAVCDGAQKALATTPDLLPVLKKAGVVDAGGQGVCAIYEGMLHTFQHGDILPLTLSNEERQKEADAFFSSVAAEFDSVITFTYCTEFIVERDPAVKKEPLALRQFLETIGDSVVVVDDEDIIKVHVHTENPGSALQEGLTFGQLLTIKIENMKEQHRKAAEENEAAKQAAATAPTAPVSDLAPAAPTEEYGFVAVAAGEGIRSLYQDLGCHQVVSGGQTMNPSTEDLMAAVLATPAKTVFLLPNNKNILLAAEQTVPLVTDRRVVVIPTRSIPQGLSAMLAFDPDAQPDQVLADMVAASQAVATGHVTFAARDSEFGGHNIHEGDILGMENGKLTFLEKDPVKACIRVTRNLSTKDTAFITLLYGNGITQEQAEAAKEGILAKGRGNFEINLVNGGQPLYYFIISVE